MSRFSARISVSASGYPLLQGITSATSTRRPSALPRRTIARRLLAAASKIVGPLRTTRFVRLFPPPHAARRSRRTPRIAIRTSAELENVVRVAHGQPRLGATTDHVEALADGGDTEPVPRPRQIGKAA